MRLIPSMTPTCYDSMRRVRLERIIERKVKRDFLRLVGRAPATKGTLRRIDMLKRIKENRYRRNAGHRRTDE